MYKLYIYNTDSREVVAIAKGIDEKECQALASEFYGDTDTYEATYSPAFGASDGLIETSDPELLRVWTVDSEAGDGINGTRHLTLDAAKAAVQRKYSGEWSEVDGDFDTCWMLGEAAQVLQHDYDVR